MQPSYLHPQSLNRAQQGFLDDNVRYASHNQLGVKVNHASTSEVYLVYCPNPVISCRIFVGVGRSNMIAGFVSGEQQTS